MGIIISLLLIVLGLIAARDYVGTKVPAMKGFVEKLNTSSEYVGIIGLLFGFIWLLQGLSLMRYAGLHAFVTLAIAVLLLILGLIYGLSLLHKFMNEPTPAFLTMCDRWRAKLLPFEQVLGLSAMVLAVLNLIV